MLNAGLDDPGPFYKQYRCIFGFVAQTAYVGAQCGVAAFVVKYISHQGIGISDSKASLMFSCCQITFTVGRFVGVAILHWVDPALLLAFYGLCCSFFTLGVSQGAGVSGVVCLYLLFFFESICYPCIFTLGTKNLGVHTKIGSGLIVMGVGGGAWFPSAQGSIANHNYRKSYLVPMAGYLTLALYAFGICLHQAKTTGFRFHNVDDLDVARAQTKANDNESDESYKKGGSIEKVSRDSKLNPDDTPKKVSSCQYL
jgi:FHS family L-fucose permease-like MFS transporter